jgi:hypothetical protein
MERMKEMVVIDVSSGRAGAKEGVLRRGTAGGEEVALCPRRTRLFDVFAIAAGALYCAMMERELSAHQVEV